MHKNLKAIREELKWSFSEMAELLGLNKPTYQGYETGRRPAPPHLLKQANEALITDRKWMKKRYRPGGEFDRIADQLHPNGIMSEVCE